MTAALHDHFFDSDGVRLRYVVTGQGAPVVLVHGFLGNVETSWIGSAYGPKPQLLAALSREYQVIALDFRGHGKSGKPHDPRKYGREMTADLLRLLDHLKLPQAHFIGYSLGAIIIGHLLAAHPERVRSAVLGGSAPYARSFYPHGRNPEADELADALESGRGLTGMLMEQIPDNLLDVKRAQAQAMSDDILFGQDVVALAAVLRASSQWSLSDQQLEENRVPTLILIGSEDPGRPVVDHVQGRMSALETVIIPGGDHVWAVEHPAFLLALQCFLKQHPMDEG